MKRIKLIIAYDGTKYCGWQLQPGMPTVEEAVNKALSELFSDDITVIGASRTDSGVHALGNVAVFDTDSRITTDKISAALNVRLPEDIRIQSSTEVEPDFHPRKTDSRKIYEYRILNRNILIPTERLYSDFVYYPLDVGAMQEAAEYLTGEHDFTSFCSVNTQAIDRVRTIYNLEVTKQGDIIMIRVTGSGFLYNMVRILTGTLIEIGRGVYPPARMAEILEGRDRSLAGPTAPAHGLTLIGIEYKKHHGGEDIALDNIRITER